MLLTSELIAIAKAASVRASNHLSHFAVGVAIETVTEKVYTGCNIEFDNYSNTIHAEESAISAMIADGENKPVRIAVYVAQGDICFPCGMCRQSLYEIGGPNLLVIACNDERHESKTMGELLPNAFSLR